MTKLNETHVGPRRRKPTPQAHLPKGWTHQTARDLAAYYDHQSDAHAIAEAEAAYRSVTTTMVQIPNELLPQVERLMQRRRRAS